MVEFYAAQDPVTQVSAKRSDTGAVVQTAIVVGRLNRGPQEVYALELFWDDEGFEVAFDTDLGPLAYLGRSASRNRPIILTDKGDLEILTASIDVADDIGLAIVDEARKRVLSRFIRPYDAAFVITATGAAAVWDQMRNICISAPERRPGRLHRMTRRCRDAGLPGKHELIGGNIELAEENAWRDHELAELIFPDRTDRDVSVFRIPGRPRFLVVPLPSGL